MASGSASSEHMYSKLPATLNFTAGIAIGAFTNVFTGLQREQLAWRIAAMIAFLTAGALLFVAALVADSALDQARRLSKGTGDLGKQFRNEFGNRGWILVSVGAASILVAVILLLIGTVLQSTGPQK